MGATIILEGEPVAAGAPPEWRSIEILEWNHDPRFRTVQVEESDSEIIVSGTVTSYYLKQMAQEAVIPIMGRRKLHNRVEVTGPFRKAVPWEA
jgi:hypothetical protein